MLKISAIEDLRRLRDDWRRDGLRVAFVPTMGNLHAGHLSLVEQAAGHADRVLVSIFVNPLQFGPAEDLEAYPRTLDQDLARLRQGPTHGVFVPVVPDLYPRGLEHTTRVTVPDLGEELCGAQRPGHFSGVTTVVNILFNLVQPDVAVFGKKDFQQLLIIRRMVADLAMPVMILAGETVRETDGLAMSSRNRYLDADQRSIAPALYRILCGIADRIKDGAADYAGLETRALAALNEAGFVPDYFSIRDAQSLGRPESSSGTLVLAAAARLGTTRLIDNLTLTLSVGS